MRPALLLCLLCGLAAVGRAQEQEKRLLDRLLKPDMTMQNDAEKKQFVAGGETITKKAPTRWFFFGKRKPEKGFWNTHQIAAKEFSTANSGDAIKTANLSTRTRIAKADVPYSAPMYGDIRTARDATKPMATSDYPASRPFILKGKSQKSLSAQDQPLTIDQVRELLNKNK
ncbi:MAG: hypothetical protein M3119_03605 [Verrucomicrobiota bacterium]|nr:hypothetical protein [Verrucomicrobiota bacterium]MDQ6939223.1 hypothetical protein [Verrucomicrobiota bacterium]